MLEAVGRATEDSRAKALIPARYRRRVYAESATPFGISSTLYIFLKVIVLMRTAFLDYQNRSLVIRMR